MQKMHCLFCGQLVELVHVHGHYQCPVCKTNAMPCCDGDNCNTNSFLNEQEEMVTARLIKTVAGTEHSP